MIGTNLLKAKMLLESNKIIAIPTETVYGLATNAFNTTSVKKLFAIKQRSLSKPFIIQTHSLEKTIHLVRYIPPQAEKLARIFWPGALTILLPKKPCIPDLVTAGKDTIGIRVPNHSLMLQLLKKLPFPLVVSSANLSGKSSPTTAQEAYNQIGHKVPYVLDGGRARLGIESTLIGFNQNNPTLYRSGYISKEAIEKVVGQLGSD